MNIIDRIINEEINKFFLTEEGSMDSLKAIFQDYYDKKNGKKKEDKPKKEKKSEEEKRKDKKERKKKEKEKRHSKRLRRTVNGGKEYYDYDDYERKNRKISHGDADSVRQKVDQTNTDIAAVARSVFPDHTEEGAQSQLRKVLNGERPMTKNVATKLNKMISAGKVAIK